MNLQIIDYIRAGYPALIVQTVEERRVLKECKRIAKQMEQEEVAQPYEFKYWTLTEGMVTNGNSNETLPGNVPDASVVDIPRNYGGRIVCVVDYHPYVKAPDVWRKLKDAFDVAKSKGITFVFISAKFDVPVELQREMVTIEFKLPTKAELDTLLTSMAEQNNIAISEKKNDILEAAMGLTYSEAENAFAMSASKTATFNPEIICEVKEKIICNGGLLEFKNSEETMNSIGGLKQFTTWAEKRVQAYSDEAQAYGLPYPKGVLLVGIPGCGKSLMAKALANMWGKPLLRLDLGKLFGGIVGETETNVRRALQIAEAMAPCILWIDEVEKGLSGIQSSGKTDSGVTSRMFGTLLTWMQEKKSPVFVIATANNIAQLPPEFLRKGRFDEIFFVDLPSQEEREEIFKIQLEKHKRNSENFNVAKLADETDEYTGSEIEECVISAMFDTWFESKREPNDDDVIKAIKAITPMSKGMMQKQINDLRDWSVKACICRANGTTATTTNTEVATRRIVRPREV